MTLEAGLRAEKSFGLVGPWPGCVVLLVCCSIVENSIVCCSIVEYSIVQYILYSIWYITYST